MPKTRSSKSKTPTWLKKAISATFKSQPSSNTRDIPNTTTESVNRSNYYHTPESSTKTATTANPPAHEADLGSLLKTRTSPTAAQSPTIPTHFKHARYPSSSRQKPAVRLPGQEQTAAAPELTRLKASQIRCTLIITYHENQDHRTDVDQLEDVIVEYEEETAFEELYTIAIDMLKQRIEKPAEAFYIKVGRFRLVRLDNQKAASRGILENKREWDEYLPWKIPEFLGQNRNVPFRVEIEWGFSSLHIIQEPNKPYAETIAAAIYAKHRDNWEGRMFIPRKDLDKILTRDIISKLIHEDESLYTADMLTLTGGAKLDVDDFIEQIWRWGGRLLALCVCTDLPLIYLYHMWKNGLRDKNLPLKKDHCPNDEYRRKFDQAVRISGGFAAHTFARNEKSELEHLQFDPDEVIPIIFDKNSDRALLGKGSFGKVFKVYIDRDHHSFSNLEEEVFALKIFYDMSAHTTRDVENESGTLARLAEAPHANITTHLASWNQNGICCMLFRCADCNLRTYMREASQPWTKANLISWISQMRGLADGLRHIHNLGPSNLEPERVNEKAKPGKRRPSETCYHHDLQPANILVTVNQDTEELLFSISDFGSAKIGQMLSGSIEPSPFTKNLSPGNASYGAPDALLEGQTSRPYDLWSIGCIFLELLTWIVGMEDKDVESFANARMEGLVNAHGNQDQAFWFQNKSGQVLLKPAVVRQLKDLKEACEGRGVFPKLVREVGKLLSPLPRDRPDASQLYSALDAILIQLRRDLKDENFYLNKMPTEVRIAAPPSSVGDSDGISRRPSIDERAYIAPYADTLSPEPRASRRSTVGTVPPIVTAKRPINHTRHQSTPEADISPGYLGTNGIKAWVDTSNLTNGEDFISEVPNTPRISLSDYGNGPPQSENLPQ